MLIDIKADNETIDLLKSAYSTSEEVKIMPYNLKAIELPENYTGVIVSLRIYYRTKKPAKEALDELVNAIKNLTEEQPSLEDADGYSYNSPDGFNADGYNWYGYDREGYHKDGYNAEGVNREGKHRYDHSENY
jgi:hypothetical protein